MSSKSDPSTTRRLQIVRQAGRYRLTTRPVVSATITNGNRPVALRHLKRLVEQGRLYCLRDTGRDPRREFVYYRRDPDPLPTDQLRVLFAVLCHCELSEPRRKLLSAKHILRLVERVCPPGTWKLPTWAHVAFERVSDAPGPRVTLIRVARQHASRSFNPADVVARLNDLVSGREFAPWWHFVRAQRFILTYLVPGARNVVQLTKWLGRSPLMSRVKDPPQVVPIQVFEAARPPYRAP